MSPINGEHRPRSLDDLSTRSEISSAQLPVPQEIGRWQRVTRFADGDGGSGWLEAHTAGVRAMVSEFALRRAGEYFTTPDTAILGDLLVDFVARGKFVRSTFAYLGWLCGRPEAAGAVQASASLELLHAFAIIQDDVREDSATRRGLPTLHVQLAEWAAAAGGVRDPGQFGRSGAILLGDLCLVWAERMLREADLPDGAVRRAWPVFDLLRSELAVGQFRDLLNENISSVSLDDVLDLTRRKSGNFSVRRPLELGAAMADCPAEVVAALTAYGTLVAEAFQLRDDVLGVYGDPQVTGKPVGDDLRRHKATSLVVAARDLADAGQAARLRELATTRPAAGADEDAWVGEWQDLITATGAAEWAEQAIDTRVSRAGAALIDRGLIPDRAVRPLLFLADRCTRRAS